MQGWAKAKARDGIPQTSVPFLPLPPGQALSLSCSAWGKHLNASHLGLGWASASWLPRLTWSWVAASSELSERRRWVCREWVRVRLLPQPTEQPSTQDLPFLFETRVVNPPSSTGSPALLLSPPLWSAHLLVTPRQCPFPITWTQPGHH